MKIVLAEPLTIQPELLEELTKPLKEAGHTFVAFDKKPQSEADWKERLEGTNVLMMANTKMPESVLEYAKDLKLVNIAFTGVDHVPVKALKEAGVQVCNAAGYSNEAVAELVIGMAINLYREIKAADAGVRNGKVTSDFLGYELEGKTVGIIGTGQIGTRTAELFGAFGAKLVGTNRTEHEAAKKLGLQYLPLDKLLETADIVSLHLPLNDETRGFLKAEHFAKMKKDAIFINCARGPIVDNKALAEALEDGKIAGAAIDVYDMEPPIPAEEPLLHAPHTLLTPHVAYYTQEAMDKRAHIAFENTVDFVDGKKVKTLV